MSKRYHYTVADTRRLSYYMEFSNEAIEMRNQLYSMMDDSLEEQDEFDDFDSSFEEVLEVSDLVVNSSVKMTIDLANYMYRPLFDPNIDFDRPPMKICDLDEHTAISDFRFRKENLQLLANLLWPRLQPYLETDDKDYVLVENGYTTTYETGFLIVVYRLAHSCRFDPEMVRFFYTNKSKVCAIFLTFLNAFYKVCKKYFTNPRIFAHRFDLYIELIQAKARTGGRLRVWGFINGTLRKTCRPTRNQKVAYSGHKRCHGIKFLTVVTPDGLIACLYGPIEGSRHDSYMLAKSKILHKLSRFIPPDLHRTERYALYGDPAYPRSSYLYSGFRNPPRNSPEAKINRKMSKVRQCVEWEFKSITTHWCFLECKNQMKILQSPVAKFYYVAAFLTNCITCIQGNQTSLYFNASDLNGRRMSITDYLNLVEIEQFGL